MILYLSLYDFANQGKMFKNNEYLLWELYWKNNILFRDHSFCCPKVSVKSQQQLMQHVAQYSQSLGGITFFLNFSSRAHCSSAHMWCLSWPKRIRSKDFIDLNFNRLYRLTYGAWIFQNLLWILMEDIFFIFEIKCSTLFYQP